MKSPFYDEYDQTSMQHFLPSETASAKLLYSFIFCPIIRQHFLSSDSYRSILPKTCLRYCMQCGISFLPIVIILLRATVQHVLSPDDQSILRYAAWYFFSSDSYHSTQSYGALFSSDNHRASPQHKISLQSSSVQLFWYIQRVRFCTQSYGAALPFSR